MTVISSQYKSKLFESVLKDFETDFYREYCREMIEQMEDYLFKVPSSSSKKYHNKTQNQAGGQFYHVLMASKICNHILNLEYIRKILTGEERRDAIRCAVILHDAKKYGSGNHTVHDHPILAAQWIVETNVEHSPSLDVRGWIGKLVSTHMGQWRTNKKSKTVLPGIESFDQFIVHLCDYLASRSDLDLVLDNSIVSEVNQIAGRTDQIVKESEPKKELDLGDALDMVVPFGKYKGKKLKDVPNNYLEWMMKNMELRSPLKECVEMIFSLTEMK